MGVYVCVVLHTADVKKPVKHLSLPLVNIVVGEVMVMERMEMSVLWPFSRVPTCFGQIYDNNDGA